MDFGEAAPVSFGSTFSFSSKKGWRDAGFSVLNEASVGQPLKTFVPGLAEVMGNDLGTAAEYRYLTQDHLGSTRGMWDASVAQTRSWEFTPYGSPYLFAGPPDVTQLYTGQDLDPVTGQYYAPFRYLEPGIGRWAKADPLGMADGTNVYQYSRSSPAMFFDRLGLYCGSGFTEVIPDTMFQCDFSEPCRRHDLCYGSDLTKSKEECDRQFLGNMLKVCEGQNGNVNIPLGTMGAGGIVIPRKDACGFAAHTYYNAVVTFGQGAFSRARKTTPTDRFWTDVKSLFTYDELRILQGLK